MFLINRNLDLTVSKGWREASLEVRKRIIKEAKNYIMQPPIEIEQRKRRFSPLSKAGLRAFFLLYKESPDLIKSLQSKYWEKWAFSILAYSALIYGNEENKMYENIISIMYQRIPSVTIESLNELIDVENQTDGNIHVVDRVTSFWNKRISDLLMNKILDSSLKPNSLEVILRLLINKKVIGVIKFCKSLINIHSSTDEFERSKSIIAAITLMNYADDAGWITIWPAIQEDIEFGRSLIEKVSNWQYEKCETVNKLSEKQLAQLYIWLVQQFPTSEDPKTEGFHTVSSRESIGTWRNGVLQNLRDRGTYKSCTEIKNIIDKFPEFEWLKFTLNEAQKKARYQTWKSLKPTVFLKLVRNSQLRVIQNGTQLLYVIIESLEKLQKKLQGKPPAAFDIWDKMPVKENIYRPIGENRLSSYIKRYLTDELINKKIIINREVEIKSPGGSRPGEDVDIKVETIPVDQSTNSEEILSVIIETKCCWHKDLDVAMKTQLYDRYLSNNVNPFGIYLIGWFNKDLWDETDYQKDKCKYTLAKTRKKFESQASSLSQSGKTIKAFILDASI